MIRTLDKTSLSLLFRLRGRDADAWTRCVHIYAPLVQQWCRRKGLTESDAEDLAQTVFLAVFQGIEQYSPDEPNATFRGWLSRITHRRIADWYGRHPGSARPRGGTEALQFLHELATPDESAADLREQTRDLYQRAIALIRDEFSPRDWQIFWRLTADGQPAPAVAAEHGLSSAAVRQVKSRVLRRIQQTLGDVAE